MEVTRFVPANPLPVVKTPAQQALEANPTERAEQGRTAIAVGVGVALGLAGLVWLVSR